MFKGNYDHVKVEYLDTIDENWIIPHFEKMFTITHNLSYFYLITVKLMMILILRKN